MSKKLSHSIFAIPHWHFLTLATIYTLLAAFISCGPYSFTGAGLPGIKTVAIPLFDNQTEEYGIREDLTNKLVLAFVQDNTLKVVNERVADAVLRGTILKYQKEAYTFDENENVKEYITRIYVKITVEDKKHNKNIWEEDNLQGWATFPSDSSETYGKSQAIDKLTADIVNRTVKGW
jgi:hypothetical protein